jgi:nucleotide-binding universal stress UspA family protein
VMTIDAKPKAFGHGDQPGANIAAHLNRWGHKVEVRNVDGAGRSAAAAIRDEAAAIGADLVVMGGYSHTRLRELMFGGATRDMLATTPVPLVMAH